MFANIHVEDATEITSSSVIRQLLLSLAGVYSNQYHAAQRKLADYLNFLYVLAPIPVWETFRDVFRKPLSHPTCFQILANLQMIASCTAAVLTQFKPNACYLISHPVDGFHMHE